MIASRVSLAPVMKLSTASETVLLVFDPITHVAYPMLGKGKLAIMASRPAGARYPFATTDVRDADHRFCPVLDAVRHRVASGREQWGVRHDMPERLTEAEAQEAKRGLYRARNHTGLKRDACGPTALSVRADYDANPDGTFSVWFQVWSRREAKREITRRVANGEQLAYNPLRRKV